MRVQLAGVGKHFGAHVILDQVTLTIGPKARIGLVGPNGVGKTTLLRIVAGQEQPDAGTVARTPSRLTVGYLEQERTAQPGALRARLARGAHGYRECRTGARSIRGRSGRRAACRGSLRGCARSPRFAWRRELRVASSGDLRRILGLGVDLDRELAGLSGGESARAALAAILLSRFDVLLLDEPTNDLDFDGLGRLERFLDGYRGAPVVVSHDREFLDRTVPSHRLD